MVGVVSRAEDVRRGVDELVSALGRLDILVNNAGILRMARFVDVTEADWRQVLAENLNGTFHGCQAALPRMNAQGSGSIVIMSSWTGKKGVPNHVAYSASKFSVIGLTQSVAGEVAEHGARVSAVCPGIIVETGHAGTRGRDEPPPGAPGVETRAKTVPMQRVGYPDEIASVLAFLASEEAAYMTGQAINVTGGL